MAEPAPRCLDPTCGACHPPAPKPVALPAPRPCANPVCPLPAARHEYRCEGCRMYQWRHGVERPAYLAQGLPVYCSVCGPPRRVKAWGRCERCYQYWWRHGGVERPAPAAPRYCPECDPPQRAKARGLCHIHYQRWWRARARAESDR